MNSSRQSRMKLCSRRTKQIASGVELVRGEGQKAFNANAQGFKSLAFQPFADAEAVFGTALACSLDQRLR